jgi:hypothetical protein
MGTPVITNNDSGAAEAKGVTLITVDEAKALVRAYQATADTPRTPVKGILFDLQVLAAMKELLTNLSDLKGFRHYFGKDKAGGLVAVIVGTDEQNRDRVDFIYKTDVLQARGLCPPVCDEQSPIIID